MSPDDPITTGGRNAIVNPSSTIVGLEQDRRANPNLHGVGRDGLPDLGDRLAGCRWPGEGEVACRCGVEVVNRAHGQPGYLPGDVVPLGLGELQRAFLDIVGWLGAGGAGEAYPEH